MRTLFEHIVDFLVYSFFGAIVLGAVVFTAITVGPSLVELIGMGLGALWRLALWFFVAPPKVLAIHLGCLLVGLPASYWLGRLVVPAIAEAGRLMSGPGDF